MAYTRVYAQRITWENEPSINTPLNDVNLNKMDYALNQIDGTLATWDTTKANQNDLLQAVKTITYDDETGQFLFTWWNGTTLAVDLNIEKIPVSFSMDANGVITMTTDDGTTYTADVGSLIKTYTFNDSGRIDFTVTTDSSGNKTVTADIVDGSITGSKLETNYLANCQAAQSLAVAAQGAAETAAQGSEAWAVGTKNGTPVPSTDPTYHNNAKYWAEQANPTVLANMSDVNITNPTTGQALVYNATTQKWENGQGGGGSSTLAGLSDVSLTNLSANQFLRYNATTQKWENFSLSAASSSNMGLIKLGAGLTVNQQGATDVDLTTTTYDNTTSGLSATTAKGAIDENAADITNKHKITQKAVDITSGWTQDSTSQSGSTFYKKQITLNHIYVDSPTVEIGAYNAVLPTTAQQTTYDYLRYVTVDDTVPCIYLYADENMMSDSDRTSFYIDIEGVD